MLLAAAPQKTISKQDKCETRNDLCSAPDMVKNKGLLNYLNSLEQQVPTGRGGQSPHIRGP